MNAEYEATQRALEARSALTVAIATYEAAGFGSHVTQPLRDALKLIEFSIGEVQS